MGAVTTSAFAAATRSWASTLSPDVEPEIFSIAEKHPVFRRHVIGIARYCKLIFIFLPNSGIRSIPYDIAGRYPVDIRSISGQSPKKERRK